MIFLFNRKSRLNPVQRSWIKLFSKLNYYKSVIKKIYISVPHLPAGVPCTGSASVSCFFFLLLFYKNERKAAEMKAHCDGPSSCADTTLLSLREPARFSAIYRGVARRDARASVTWVRGRPDVTPACMR